MRDEAERVPGAEKDTRQHEGKCGVQRYPHGHLATRDGDFTFEGFGIHVCRWGGRRSAADGAGRSEDSALWLQSGISGTNAAQPAIGASVLLADGATTMPSGEVNPAIVAVSLTAAPATSGTALSTVSSNTAKTFVDGSGNVLMWDGIIAQALNNASQANGATLGAQVAQPASSDGKLALADIDNLLASMYLQAAGDPDCIVMNPLDNVRLTNLVVSAGQLRYVLQVGDGGDQGQLTAQYRVTRYLNKSTGKEIPILLDRYCPQGQSDRRIWDS